jgi:hypothetical protein
MTTRLPGGRPEPFGPDDLSGIDLTAEELAAETRLGRDLERIASQGRLAPSTGFADRVMAAVTAEPVPAPVIVAGNALRHGAAFGLLAAIRDAFRITLGGGFPIAARAQALALVLLVVVVAGGSGFATAGALGVFSAHPGPSPRVVAPPTGTPAPSASPDPTDTPDATFDTTDPSMSVEPSGELDPSETGQPEDTSEPEDTARPTKDSGSGATAQPTRRPTPKPTHRPKPSETPEPSDHEEHHDAHPTDTPKPSPSPSASPSPSPHHTAEH